ncbi:MAG TPA: DUF493 family protein [Bacteroidia bacterium]|nr:DUF493 family protein [Bacteroidia bacterium]
MNKNDPYENLRKELNKIGNWPQVYMFKFIIPADNKRIALVESKFSNDSIITKKESANGKYISITIKEVMLSADSIIDKYKEMEGIEGLMAF